MMAYLAFPESGGIPGAATVQAPQRDTTLSALEWTIVALAERDRVASLRTPGRVSRAMATLFGGSHNPQLADPRLEALRRMAVLTWHYGYTVPSAAVKDFLAAGFTGDQYELLVDSIASARRPRRGR
jgi:hypothetical protein